MPITVKFNSVDYDLDGVLTLRRVTAPDDSVLFELPTAVAVHDPLTISFSTPPATAALRITGELILGGDLYAQHPLLYLTLGDASSWRTTTAPLYLFARPEEILLRVRDVGEWTAPAKRVGITKLTAGSIIRFDGVVLPDRVRVEVVGVGMSMLGVASPFGDLRLQIGHKDAVENDVGDEELPRGTVLNALRVEIPQGMGTETVRRGANS